MFNLGFGEVLLILIVALVIFGPSKLPEAGKAMGKAINEFKRASRDIQKEINEAAQKPKEN
jgi:TatA/E family protein of Tat protein translocase